MSEHDGMSDKQKIVLAVSAMLVFGIILAGGFFLLSTLRYSFYDDLVISVSTNKQNFKMYQNQTENVSFKLTVDANWFCSTECNISFSDLSSYKNEDKQTIVTNNNFSSLHTIKTPLYGKGQKLYRYTATCQNIKQAPCLTTGSTVERSVLITVDYGPSPELKLIIENITPQLKSNLESIAQTDINVKQSAAVLEKAPSSFKYGGSKNKFEEIKLAYLKIKASEIHSLWDLERYSKLETFINNSFQSQVSKSLIKSEIIKEEIETAELRHNEYVNQLNSNFVNSNNIDEAMRLSNAAGDKSLKTLTDELSDLINKLKLDFYRGNYKDYADLDKRIEQVNNLKILFDQKIDKTRNETKDLVANELNDLIEKNCIIKEYCKTSLEVTDLDFACDINKSLIKTSATKYYLTKIANNTLGHNASIKEIFEYNNLTNWLWSDEYNKSVEKYYSILMANPAATINNSDLLRLGMKIKIKNTICPILKTPSNFSFNQINLSYFNITWPEVKTDINTSLTIHSPECCVFSECKPCCTTEKCLNDPQTYPIILVHGHSFNKEVSPDYALNGFDKIQNSLEKDGFISAGFLSAETDVNKIGKGNWGFFGHPVTIAATYYYNVYNEEGNMVAIPQKSESIDVYSIRLHEIVENVKFLTGRPKVNIIAHSMGGLVARRYIQIFGDNSVDKLIMLGTPNLGIEGQTKNLCGVLGENRECTNMEKGSTFMKKINDPTRQPHFVQMTTITGVGCDMDLGDGDGIVLASNVAIPNAVNIIIHGTCPSKINNLHLQMLDIDKYPEVYQHIKIALLS